MNIAIIPARKGSKSLHDKNIRELEGKPLMAYTIETALQSNLFETVLVSTDSTEYAKIATRYGASVPFLRPKELAEDAVPSSEVTKHVLQHYGKQNKHYSNFAVLQISSPLRNTEDLQASYKIFIEKRAESVVSVCRSSIPKPWVNTLPPDKSLKNFITEKFRNAPRQALSPYYKIHGAIFWGNVSTYLKNSDPFTQNSFAYVMPPQRSIDIDTDIDFELVKILYRRSMS